MFERYTEKARRIILFARYDASQYGSRMIETEHLLLGLLREDLKTAKLLIPNLASAEQIQRAVASRITRGERVSTSVEMPLSIESKQVLNIAADESVKLAHRHVGTEHILLGLLLVKKGMASEILNAEPVDLDELRKRIGQLPAART